MEGKERFLYEEDGFAPVARNHTPLIKNYRRVYPPRIRGKRICQLIVCVLLFGLTGAAAQTNFIGAESIRKAVYYTLNTDYNLTAWLQRWPGLGIKPDLTLPTLSESKWPEFIYPVTAGKVIKLFEPGLMPSDNFPESGITLETASGQMVRASYAGKVIEVTSDARLGYTILIDHGQGIYSITTGCSKILVQSGEQVLRGQIMGQIGAPGEEKRHLYFAIKKQETPVDPLLFIQNTHKP